MQNKQTFTKVAKINLIKNHLKFNVQVRIISWLELVIATSNLRTTLEMNEFLVRP